MAFELVSCISPVIMYLLLSILISHSLFFYQPMIEDFGSLNVTAALRSTSSIMEEEKETVGASQDSKILNKGTSSSSSSSSSGGNAKDGKY